MARSVVVVVAAWAVAAAVQVAAARARVVAMRAVAKELWVTVAGAEAEETGQVNRERGEAEAMGRGSMVTAARAREVSLAREESLMVVSLRRSNHCAVCSLASRS